MCTKTAPLAALPSNAESDAMADTNGPVWGADLR